VQNITQLATGESGSRCIITDAVENMGNADDGILSVRRLRHRVENDLPHASHRKARGATDETQMKHRFPSSVSIRVSSVASVFLHAGLLEDYSLPAALVRCRANFCLGNVKCRKRAIKFRRYCQFA
jgi:hypothetical protein